MSKIFKKNKPRKVVSRRGRPAKPPLSQDVIVEKALDLLQCGGLSGLSLRKIATELDTGPASLYVYVNNLGELYDLMLDRVLGDVEIPEPETGSWRDRLRLILMSYTKILFSRPGLGRLSLTTMSGGPNMLRLMDGVLSTLLEGGMDPARASLSMDLFLLHFSAIAGEKDLWRDHGNPMNGMEEALENISPDQFPALYKTGPELMSFDGDRRFQWALDMLITGAFNTPI